jgi:nitrite reductase/ring-hydroxylating ferredoxin subunit
VVTGLADWHHTYPAGPRRAGLAHGLINIAATGLYGAALVLRLQGDRGAGRTAAFAGYAVLAVGAYVGGHLAHALRVGVNQAIEVPELQPDHEKYVPVMAERDLQPDKLTRANMKGFRIVLVRHNGAILAFSDLCSHLGCSLAEEGKVDRGELLCTCHGSRFALADGRVLNGPASSPQPCFETRIRDGMIEVGATKETWSGVVPTPAASARQA